MACNHPYFLEKKKIVLSLRHTNSDWNWDKTIWFCYRKHYWNALKVGILSKLSRRDWIQELRWIVYLYSHAWKTVFSFLYYILVFSFPKMQCEWATEEQNKTYITEFILLGFGDLPDLQVPLFLLFLDIHMVIMMVNILILMLAVDYQHLHIPVYFFLSNLCCLEMCYASTILPKLLVSFLTGNRSISYSTCMTQF